SALLVALSRSFPTRRSSDLALIPVVAGGTGFYLRALLDGLFRAPSRDDALRTRLAGREQSRPGSLHRLLRRFDSPAAQAIHPNRSEEHTSELQSRVDLVCRL